MLNFKKLVLGTFLSTMLCAVLLAAAAFCIQKVGLPSEAVSGTVGLAVGVLAVFGGSVITSLWSGEKGMLYGALLSLIFLIFFIAIGLLVCKETNWMRVFVCAAAFTIGGALGGILGVNHTQHIRF